MLVRLGRAKKAVEYSLVRLADPEEALAVAGALPELGIRGPRCGSGSMVSRCKAARAGWQTWFET
jgi:hypothetical protein